VVKSIIALLKNSALFSARSAALRFDQKGDISSSLASEILILASYSSAAIPCCDVAGFPAGLCARVSEHSF
jgi:hypothetical protein